RAFAVSLPPPPAVSSLAPPPARKGWGALPMRAKALVASAMLGACLMIAALVLVVRSYVARDARIKSAVVRVTTPSGFGTGFFVKGPDDLVYVATAYHVIDRGEPALVERNVELSDKSYFVEAYPDTEVVAADADADIAILRVKNLSAGRFERLALA